MPKVAPGMVLGKEVKKKCECGAQEKTQVLPPRECCVALGRSLGLSEPQHRHVSAPQQLAVEAEVTRQLLERVRPVCRRCSGTVSRVVKWENHVVGCGGGTVFVEEMAASPHFSSSSSPLTAVCMKGPKSHLPSTHTLGPVTLHCPSPFGSGLDHVTCFSQ